MSKVRIHIDGKEITAYSGQMLADVAAQNGIEIPTLCHDQRVKPYGACGICVVEAAHTNKLIRACSTEVFEGMMITTSSPRVYSTRQSALELLLSDHTGDCRPPCVLACPGETDCQGYVGLVAMGEYDEALKLVKDKIPLPGSIGRVCPHPCEDACRRELVEEPVSIADIKAFLGDKDMENSKLFTPDVPEDSGKKVAVIGGGPGGLSAAYFLRQHGHAVDIYDMMPHMGGMLYYGIPEYRLPKDYLLKEVDAIRDMGVTFHNNINIGKDLTLQQLRDNFDAVLVATGAWSSTPLRAIGEDLDGVVGGIDFLRDVVEGRPKIGKNVAIVGGGNTAMDACRTAVRLGAENVYNVYRRTKDQMPAEQIEIIEAEEEGVIFKELTNPLEVLGVDGKVSGVRLQVMELGEPDDSGRRRPVPVEGKEEELEIDTLIVAIGQKLDARGLEGIELTDWDTIDADENTFVTNLDGVFAIGDATNDGADIAITAIGEARKAAEVIHPYLYGRVVPYKEPYVVTEEVTAERYADREKIARAKMEHRSPENRKNNFLEINYGLTDEAASAEGARCLECGCHDFFECRLIAYANQYDVHPDKFDGDVHARQQSDDHPYIQRNSDKCILCGLCVRVCEEVVGATALGLVERGFDTIVAPSLDLPLGETECISCGQCVAVCPTGALLETMQAPKQVPTLEQSVVTTCAFCGDGCQQELTYTGDTLFRALPFNKNPEDALLCSKGRFGFGQIQKAERLTAGRRRDGETLDLRENAIYLGKQMQALGAVHGPESLAVAIGGGYTNEDAFLIREYAHRVLGTDKVFTFGEIHSGITPVLGRNRSTATIKELERTDYVLMVEMDLEEPNTVAGFSIKRGAKNGAQVVAINSCSTATDEFADQVYLAENDLSLLKSILKSVLLTDQAKEVDGYDELWKSVEYAEVCPDGTKIASDYLNARNGIIVFEQNAITAEAATLLANIALAAGKAFGPRNGILQLKDTANAQGLADLGIPSFEDVQLDNVKGLILFGEQPDEDLLPELDFLAVHQIELDDLAYDADLALPAQGYAEISGTFTSSDNHVGAVVKAVDGPVEHTLFEQLQMCAETMEQELPWANQRQIAQDWVEEMANIQSTQPVLVAVETEDDHPLYRHYRLKDAFVERTLAQLED